MKQPTAYICIHKCKQKK